MKDLLCSFFLSLFLSFIALKLAPFFQSRVSFLSFLPWVLFRSEWPITDRDRRERRMSDCHRRCVTFYFHASASWPLTGGDNYRVFPIDLSSKSPIIWSPLLVQYLHGKVMITSTHFILSKGWVNHTHLPSAAAFTQLFIE